MSTLYAITNQKGGTAKSTTCICVGAALVELGKRVLIVDLDPQAGLTTSLGRDPDSFDKTIYNALIDEAFPVSQITIKTKTQNLYFIPITVGQNRSYGIINFFCTFQYITLVLFYLKPE